MKNLIFTFFICFSFLLNAQADSDKKDSLTVTSKDKKWKQKEVAIPILANDNEKPEEDLVAGNEKASPLVTETREAAGTLDSVIDYVDTFIEVGLEYPLNFGVHGKFHVNDSFYTRLGLGFTPALLVGGFKRLAPSLGYLNRQEADLIGDAIQNSLFGSLRFGWLPYTKKVGGPYMELGLIGLMWGKGETSATALNEAIGTDLNQAGNNRYSVKSNLVGGTFHIGYQIPIEKHVRLNVELGVLKILYSYLRESEGNVTPLPEKHHEDYKDFLVRKGWVFPTISAWLGFSF